MFQSLQRELDSFQSRISSLYQLSDAISQNMDTNSIVGITSRQSAIEAKLMSLRQIIGKQVELLQGDLSQKQQFKDLFYTMATFLEYADKMLSKKELDKSTDERTLRVRHEELKLLTSEFNVNMGKLDSLNDLGYRMALNEETSLDLRELNHKFHTLYSDVKEKNKTLQGLLLAQQDFSEKCDEWKIFLAQTERDLSTDMAGNLSDLIEQQRKCEVGLLILLVLCNV